VQELQHAISKQKQLLAVMQIIDPESKYTHDISDWELVLAKEYEISTLLDQQNQLQATIIDHMVTGDATAINDSVAQAQSVNELLRVASTQLNKDVMQLLE
jgi:hypothetical protein